MDLEVHIVVKKHDKKMKHCESLSSEQLTDQVVSGWSQGD